jgi:hypothetical protein
MKDLTNIPERFHILFTDVSWSSGNESKMGALQRSNINQLYLEYNKWSIEQIINPPSTNNEEEVVKGFIKD